MKNIQILFVILLFSYSAFAQYVSYISYNKDSKVLDISNLNINTLPDSIKEWQNIEIIKFTRCTNLNYRKLYRSIKHFYNLKTILFDDCKIGKIPPLVYKLENLRSVRISGDSIQSVPRKFYKTKIKELILDDDKIGTISQKQQKKMFERLLKSKSLSSLHLFNNKIDTLYSCFKDSKLCKLDLGGNYMENSYSILTELINENRSFELCLAYPQDSIKFIDFLKSVDHDLILQIYLTYPNDKGRESINIYRSINSKAIIGTRYRN